MREIIRARQKTGNMGAAEDIRKVFGSDNNLYDIMGVTREAPASQIKKAYLKLALKVHPDRNGGDPEATKKFQALSLVHSILSDSVRREQYDETGCVEDDSFDVSNSQWTDYWRELFPKVSFEDIEAFEVRYKGSSEEKQDVVQAYQDLEGDMEQMLEHIVLASEEQGDEERFRQLLRPLIASGDIPTYPAFTAGEPGRKNKNKQKKNKTKTKGLRKEEEGDKEEEEKARQALKKRRAKKRKAEQEAVEAAELREIILNKHRGGGGGSSAVAAALEGGGEEGLIAAITLGKSHREQRFSSMLDGLEARYGGGGGGGGGKKKKKKGKKSEIR